MLSFISATHGTTLGDLGTLHGTAARRISLLWKPSRSGNGRDCARPPVSFTGASPSRTPSLSRTAVTVPEDCYMVKPTVRIWLGPASRRACEPAFTRLVAEQIARDRGSSLEAVARQTATRRTVLPTFPGSPDPFAAHAGRSHLLGCETLRPLFLLERLRSCRPLTSFPRLTAWRSRTQSTRLSAN